MECKYPRGDDATTGTRISVHQHRESRSGQLAQGGNLCWKSEPRKGFQRIQERWAAGLLLTRQLWINSL